MSEEDYWYTISLFINLCREFTYGQVMFDVKEVAPDIVEVVEDVQER